MFRAELFVVKKCQLDVAASAQNRYAEAILLSEVVPCMYRSVNASCVSEIAQISSSCLLHRISGKREQIFTFP